MKRLAALLTSCLVYSVSFVASGPEAQPSTTRPKQICWNQLLDSLLTSSLNHNFTPASYSSESSTG